MISHAFDRPWVRATLGVLVLLTTLNDAVQAQAPALLTGIVVDEAGSAVPGARVTASDVRGSIVQTTATDGAGSFTVRGLMPASLLNAIVSSKSIALPLGHPATLRPRRSFRCATDGELEC